MAVLHFVRDAMLPQVAPPMTERGLVKWLRQNLFSSAFNTVLTLVAIYVIYQLVQAAMPWLLNGVWNATSLTECRSIIAANGGEASGGACWAMIHARWYQWIFGFYPQDQYWRPTLAFVLLFAALAPVLFPAIPKKLLWFTALYPAICFFLLWGGSIWLPVVALLGFAVLALGYSLAARVTGPSLAAGVGVVAAVLFWEYGTAPLVGLLSRAIPVGLPAVASDAFGGFLLAITIGVTAIAFSLPIGILLALGRQSDMMIVKSLSVCFIEFIRGVPLITLLFTASLLLQYFLPPGTSFDIILRVIILVTLFAAAYLAEVIRGGLAALPRGQYEAADALGLDYWRAQRLIILPQALKISIPSIVSTFIGLFKDTTLVSFVGLFDPLRGVTNAVRSDINWKGIYWEPYIFVGAIFFVLCFSMSRYSMYLENKLKTDHR
jgi:general L-amino acid transport system permease protein